MLTVENLVVQRGGKPVLHGVSLGIRPAEITALVGANGAGKSSLVMTIAGAVQAQAGAIHLAGKSLLGLRPEVIRAHGVAVVAEGHRVLNDLSVRDNLRVAASHRPRHQEQQAIDQVLAVLPELIPKLDSLGKSLSGGQKQMVCIAQALLAEPAYLIIDELSLGLAPTVIKRLAEVIQTIVREQGTGVLLIEQFTRLALSLSSQANVLVRGKISWTGQSADLLENPDILRSSYLAA